jgi:hypothetical protein
MAGDVDILYQKDLYQNIIMKLKFNLTILIAVFVLFAGNLKAQTTTPDIKPSHLKAAEQCLVAMGINTQFSEIMSRTIKASSTQIPEAHRASYLKVMDTFIAKYLTWDTIKENLSKIYAGEFTEDELVKLTAFYNSSLGKKVSSKTPILTEKGMLLGQQMVSDHKAELGQMMQQAFQNDDPPTIKDQQN